MGERTTNGEKKMLSPMDFFERWGLCQSLTYCYPIVGCCPRIDRCDSIRFFPSRSRSDACEHR